MAQKVQGYFDSAFAQVSGAASLRARRCGARGWGPHAKRRSPQLGVPVTALVAPGKDVFRKPEAGMWRALCAMNGGLAPDLSASFFVGDAAGRDGDHSDCDSEFAENVGVPFDVPEAAFPVPAWPPLGAARAPRAASRPEQAAAAQPEEKAAPAQPAEEAVPADVVIVLE